MIHARITRGPAPKVRLALLVLAVGCAGQAGVPVTPRTEPARGPIGSDELARDLTAFAHDSMRGREAGTADATRAAQDGDLRDDATQQWRSDPDATRVIPVIPATPPVDAPPSHPPAYAEQYEEPAAGEFARTEEPYGWRPPEEDAAPRRGRTGWIVAVVLLVLAGIQVGDSDLRGAAAITFFGYLLAGLVLLPIGFLWSLTERSRGATAVLAVVGLTQAFVVVRALQVWPS